MLEHKPNNYKALEQLILLVRRAGRLHETSSNRQGDALRFIRYVQLVFGSVASLVFAWYRHEDTIATQGGARFRFCFIRGCPFSFPLFPRIFRAVQRRTYEHTRRTYVGHTFASFMGVLSLFPFSPVFFVRYRDGHMRGHAPPAKDGSVGWGREVFQG